MRERIGYESLSGQLGALKITSRQTCAADIQICTDSSGCARPACYGSAAGGAPGIPDGGFNLPDICDSDDLGIVILVALLVLAIGAAAVYVIWAAPAILSEAAFQGVLAAALTRRAKKISHGTWEGSVFRATVIPFAIVLLFAVALGIYAQKRCPSAMRLREAIHCIR